MYKFEFPWSLTMVAWSTGGGAILASLVTIQPWWALLMAAVGFDLLCGALAARRSRELSFVVVENRVLTNLMVLAVSKFFYLLSEFAHHFKVVHPMAGGDPITEMYPFGDWVAWVGLAFIVRSILAHAAVVGYSLPFVTEWVDKFSAKPGAPVVPISSENPAAGGSLQR